MISQGSIAINTNQWYSLSLDVQVCIWVYHDKYNSVYDPLSPASYRTSYVLYHISSYSDICMTSQVHLHKRYDQHAISTYTCSYIVKLFKSIKI